jgi:hypothetical protein
MHAVLLILSCICALCGCSELCRGVICGNAQFTNSSNPLIIAETPTVRFLVYSVWVGEPLNANRLNHKVYCDVNGYEYRHFYMSPADFAANYTNGPRAWYSVYVARELLQTSDADYFFKMDIDCLFARTDVRLESLIDPLQRYSFYTTNIEPTQRFMQSQSWILKKSEYGKALINEWLEYVSWGTCGNLAYEQGAMHLMIGMAYSWHIGANGTEYTCPKFCKFDLQFWSCSVHTVLPWFG